MIEHRGINGQLCQCTKSRRAKVRRAKVRRGLWNLPIVVVI